MAEVVYPPVDTEYFTPEPAGPRTHYLIVSALVPYKRVETAVEACRALGRPLIVAGDGPDRARLEALGGAGVTFTGASTSEQIRDLYRSAHAVFLPGEEDFGIVPVEAQACGTPVIALGRGGALETVVDGRTGILVRDSSASAFADGITRAEAITWDRAVIRAHTERFAATAFAAGFSAVVSDVMDHA
ncbi:MAG: glycosyltransferase [Acidobacteria bacterium]|nr:glycosyltransferase [Acidobacteriota bacterium]